MSSKICFTSIMLACLLASFALFVPNAEAASPGSTKMTLASSLGFQDHQVSPQNSCYFCDYYSVTRCCNYATTGGRKDKSTDISQTTGGGDKVNPEGICYYCGYFQTGLCLTCTNAKANAAAEGVKPKN
ncbi:hypothetical protein SAY87_021223 [Trapa incisa]|uniref:Uncharacterized protein n=1 Tax=Trapa incisa TaxID=236973 RepID=A0AAN7JSY1_9MYRT|nr:hypothetical protein SAY87_021223 [Trapa incisa]